MSVGDLKNNLRKLQTELRSIKYEKDVDVDSLSKGVVTAFLPLYHYLFVGYSHHVSQLVVDKHIELAGKTDLRFMEAMYKVLREIFSYKPPITKEQFFANGFVERKVIMCTEIIRLVKEKHKSLAPKTTKSRAKSGGGQVAKLGPRSASSGPPSKSKDHSKNSSLESVSESVPTSARSMTQNQSMTPKQLIPPDADIQVQVVNEIRKAVESSMPSFLSPSSPEQITSQQCPMHSSSKPTDPVVKDIRKNAKAFVMETETVTIDQPVSMVTMKPTVIREESEDDVSDIKTSEPWNDMEAVVVTSGDKNDKSSRQVAGYNPARYGGNNQEQQQILPPTHAKPPMARIPAMVPHPRPIDMIAMTPVKPVPIKPVQKYHENSIASHPRPIDMIAMTPAKPTQGSQGLRQDQGSGEDEVQERLMEIFKRLEKSVCEITNRIQGCENRLGVVESLLTMQQQQKDTSVKRSEELAPVLETLMARMTLIENKVSLVEVQRSKDRNLPRYASVAVVSDRTGLANINGAATPSRSPPPIGLSPIVTKHQAAVHVTNDNIHNGNAPIAASTIFDSANGTPHATEEYDRRWSSTPTELPGSAGVRQDRNEALEGTITQAERIKLMMQDTQSMIDLQIDTPVRPAAIAQ